MKESFRKGWHFVGVLLLLFRCAPLEVGAYRLDVSNYAYAKTNQIRTEGVSEMANKLAARQVSGGFASSLKSREAAEFLLTPAILVQENISDGVVITYPSD
jgi:hypothetical protein